jgi:ABC-2 type transport system ATP-binding protein
MLEIRGFSKTYPGGKKAVDNLNLSIESGDICGFIGRNGAGKTTTIKAVCGILDFEEGTIEVDGKDIKVFPVEAKSVMAYIPDNPVVYAYMTGIKYLTFIGDIYKVPRSVQKEKIEKYAEMFELKNALGNSVTSYSHGMLQKLVIIGALIHEPKLLILDEPFVGLDPIATHQLRQIFKQMCEEGTAIFFSTHVLEVAQKICNKIAIIKDGRLVASGKTEEITKNDSLEDVFLELNDKLVETENE